MHIYSLNKKAQKPYKKSFALLDSTLENARQQLIVALLNFNQDSHFAFINAAVNEIQVSR